MGDNSTSLSVLCADIGGVASLSRIVDKPEALHALRHCQTRIRLALEHHGGRPIRCSGNRLMGFFTSHVDALQAAIEMQRRVSRLPPCAGIALTLQIGLCSGHQRREERYFPGDGPNPAARLAADAEPGHILLSIPRRLKHFPWTQLAGDRVPNISLSCGQRRLGVFHLPWQERDPSPMRRALTQLVAEADGLRLRYGERDMVVDGKRPRLTIGRLADCDIALSDGRCSRVHGVIEKRLDRFVFVDHSRNGTFLSADGQAEIFVHRQEVELSGCGQLSLGSPASRTGVEVLQFQTGSAVR
jgi:hypothetical protein